jgi:hypothetical protein
MWEPPPRIKPSVWMERELTVPSEETAVPGRYRFTRHEFLREIVDSAVDPTIEVVAVQKPSQVGWTLAFTALACYFVRCDPSRILVAQPVADEAEVWSKDRLEPVVRASPTVAALIRPAKQRDANNKILHKRFPGGALKLVGANSPTGLASWPAKRIMLDEVDRYPASAGDEGDPIVGEKACADLPAARRQAARGQHAGPGRAQPHRGPGRPGRPARVAGAVPPPGLPGGAAARVRPGEMVEGRRRAPPDGDGGLPLRGLRPRVVRHAADRERGPRPLGADGTDDEGPQLPDRRPDVARRDARRAGADWIAARTDEKRKVFVNTSLGRTWAEETDAPDWKDLARRREPLSRDVLPDGVLMLTCGVDVQKRHLTYTVWGWGAAARRGRSRARSFRRPPKSPRRGRRSTRCWPASG